MSEKILSKITSVFCRLSDGNGSAYGDLIANAKVFSTGSRGFYANGKLVIGGKAYQVNVQLVEIGSKPAAK